MLSSQGACACVLVCLSVSMGVRARAGVGDETPRPPRNRLTRIKNCTQPQSNIDFKELMGLWKVIEVIEHSERYSERRNHLRAVTRTDYCPVVHFATDDDREVRMIWNDQGGYIQYTFRMTNINNPGFWISSPYQSGTMVDNQYEHFYGTAQVMKAVQSHMVLTFCAPHDRHFSIILSRTNYLSHEETRGVHKQLNRINLPLVSVQEYCRSAGVSIAPSAVLAALLALLLSCGQLTS